MTANLRRLGSGLFRGLVCASFFVTAQGAFGASENVIEKQLEEIGGVPNEEVVVVQRKYTRKQWRHEFTPVGIGGLPFGTVRRTLMGGASYTLHANDWLALELINFTYSKTFLTSFTEDINKGQIGAGQSCNPTTGVTGPDKACINPDLERPLFYLTSGIQIAPFYGKVATFSRFIGYIEPFFYLGAGIGTTELASRFSVVPGVGFRLFFKEWFSMRFDFRDYIYTTTSSVTGQSTMQNNYSVMLSLSFWLPKMPSI